MIPFIRNARALRTPVLKFFVKNSKCLDIVTRCSTPKVFRSVRHPLHQCKEDTYIELPRGLILQNGHIQNIRHTPIFTKLTFPTHVKYRRTFSKIAKKKSSREIKKNKCKKDNRAEDSCITHKKEDSKKRKFPFSCESVHGKRDKESTEDKKKQEYDYTFRIKSIEDLKCCPQPTSIKSMMELTDIIEERRYQKDLTLKHSANKVSYFSFKLKKGNPKPCPKKGNADPCAGNTPNKKSGAKESNKRFYSHYSKIRGGHIRYLTKRSYHKKYNQQKIGINRNKERMYPYSCSYDKKKLKRNKNVIFKKPVMLIKNSSYLNDHHKDTTVTLFDLVKKTSSNKLNPGTKKSETTFCGYTKTNNSYRFCEKIKKEKYPLQDRMEIHGEHSSPKYMKFKFNPENYKKSIKENINETKQVVAELPRENINKEQQSPSAPDKITKILKNSKSIINSPKINNDMFYNVRTALQKVSNKDIFEPFASKGQMLLDESLSLDNLTLKQKVELDERSKTILAKTIRNLLQPVIEKECLKYKEVKTALERMEKNLEKYLKEPQDPNNNNLKSKIANFEIHYKLNSYSYDDLIQRKKEKKDPLTHEEIKDPFVIEHKIENPNKVTNVKDPFETKEEYVDPLNENTEMKAKKKDEECDDDGFDVKHQDRWIKYDPCSKTYKTKDYLRKERTTGCKEMGSKPSETLYHKSKLPSQDVEVTYTDKGKLIAKSGYETKPLQCRTECDRPRPKPKEITRTPEPESTYDPCELTRKCKDHLRRTKTIGCKQMGSKPVGGNPHKKHKEDEDTHDSSECDDNSAKFKIIDKKEEFIVVKPNDQKSLDTLRGDDLHRLAILYSSSSCNNKDDGGCTKDPCKNEDPCAKEEMSCKKSCEDDEEVKCPKEDPCDKPCGGLQLKNDPKNRAVFEKKRFDPCKKQDKPQREERPCTSELKLMNDSSNCVKATKSCPDPCENNEIKAKENPCNTSKPKHPECSHFQERSQYKPKPNKHLTASEVTCKKVDTCVEKKPCGPEPCSKHSPAAEDTCRKPRVIRTQIFPKPRSKSADCANSPVPEDCPITSCPPKKECQVSPPVCTQRGCGQFSMEPKEPRNICKVKPPSPRPCEKHADGFDVPEVNCTETKKKEQKPCDEPNAVCLEAGKDIVARKINESKSMQEMVTPDCIKVKKEIPKPSERDLRYCTKRAAPTCHPPKEPIREKPCPTRPVAFRQSSKNSWKPVKLQKQHKTDSDKKPAKKKGFLDNCKDFCRSVCPGPDNKKGGKKACSLDFAAKSKSLNSIPYKPEDLTCDSSDGNQNRNKKPKFLMPSEQKTTNNEQQQNSNHDNIPYCVAREHIPEIFIRLELDKEKCKELSEMKLPWLLPTKKSANRKELGSSISESKLDKTSNIKSNISPLTRIKKEANDAKKMAASSKQTDPCVRNEVPKKIDVPCDENNPYVCLKRIRENQLKKIQQQAATSQLTQKQVQGPTKQEQSCKKKEDPCKKKEDPCKKKEDPCKKKQDPCKKKEDPCAKDKEDEDPYACTKKIKENKKKQDAKKTQVKVDSGKPKEDPCKKKEDPCKKKEDPCKKKEDPCKKKDDPCKKKEDPCKKKEDPCKKKEDPCKKKEDPCKKKEDPCKKKEDPCKKKEDPCKKKEDPCKKKEDPCKKKEDPCKKKEDPCKKKEDPCKKKEDPCKKKEDPCKKKEDPCKKKEDPCKKKEDPCKKKEDPCKKKEDPCKKKEDPCKKKEDPCKKKEDPCKKKEDPCKKKEAEKPTAENWPCLKQRSGKGSRKSLIKGRYPWKTDVKCDAKESEVMGPLQIDYQSFAPKPKKKKISLLERYPFNLMKKKSATTCPPPEKQEDVCVKSVKDSRAPEIIKKEQPVVACKEPEKKVDPCKKEEQQPPKEVCSEKKEFTPSKTGNKCFDMLISQINKKKSGQMAVCEKKNPCKKTEEPAKVDSEYEDVWEEAPETCKTNKTCEKQFSLSGSIIMQSAELCDVPPPKLIPIDKCNVESLPCFGNETYLCEVKKLGKTEQLVCRPAEKPKPLSEQLEDNKSGYKPPNGHVDRLLKCQVIKQEGKEVFFCKEIAMEGSNECPEEIEATPEEILKQSQKPLRKDKKKRKRAMVKVVSHKLVCRQGEKENFIGKIMEVQEVKIINIKKRKKKEKKLKPYPYSYKDLQKLSEDMRKQAPEDKKEQSGNVVGKKEECKEVQEKVKEC